MSSTRWRAAAPPSGRRRTAPVSAANIARLEQRFVAPERFNLWPQAHLHTQWPGTGKPGDPAFDQFYASQFPSLVDFPLQQALNRDATVALLDKIGPAVLLIHSQSGAFGWPVADERPKLVKAILAVEPNGPPVHDVEFKGAPDWFADNPHTKASGLGDVPLTYDPPLTEAAPLDIRARGQAGETGPRALLAAGRAGAQARQPAEASRS